MTYNYNDWKDNSPLLLESQESASLTSLGRRQFRTAAAMVDDIRPDLPVQCVRPHVLHQAARWFIQNFPGEVLYAVKCNPDPTYLAYLYEGGVRHFDVASLKEIALIRRLFPYAPMYYMHPVKSRESIRRAYFTYGIRDFALDSMEELHKIIEETNSATDLNLHVRMGMPKGSAAHDLSGKFGADGNLTVELLQAVNKIAAKVGLCFHVGSQCMHPDSYRQALRLVGEVLKRAQVELDVLDVGGGFPVSYAGMTPPPMGGFIQAITKGVEELKLPAKCKLWCEPGRALVAEAGSLVVRVELRKDNKLYINDGSYGALFDATYTKTRFPVRLIRASGSTHGAPLKAFNFYGPTCDSLDVMPGPFMLPEDITEGDWIEIGQTGAYSASMRTSFNGFDDALSVELWDEPQLRTPDYVPPTERRTVNKGSVLNLNRLVYLREAYETEMS